jgi:uncharacterized RDD family membrane protein YckC
MSEVFPAPPPEARPAGAWRRIAALVYDSFLLFGLLVVPLFVLNALIHAGSSAYGAEGVAHDLPPLAPKWMIQLYWVLVIAAFYSYFWRRHGQTLGMQAWRLQLTRIDGGRPSLQQCLLRLFIGLPALLLGGLGYWWIWIDRERLAWHDRASDTRVVVLPKKKKKG